MEREWLDTVSTLDSDNIDYTDYVDAGAMLAEELKRKGEETVRIDNVLGFLFYFPLKVIAIRGKDCKKGLS